MIKAVIMGVAGCGKSSVGRAAALHLGASYVEGDDLHPASNIAKMQEGIPLTDADRAPWLDQVGFELRGATTPVLLGCSALKRRYRDRIRRACPEAVFVHLSGTRDLIEARMSARKGHFMPVSLLDSQFAALEELGGGELGYRVDIAQTVDLVVADVVRYLRNPRAGSE